MITNRVNTASENDIYKCLLACNEHFIPKLSERVDLKQYSQKIFRKATNFEAWTGDNLIGIVSVYFNPSANGSFGYITNVCVVKEFAGMGVAQKLMDLCIKHAADNKINRLELEVNTQNVLAIRFYKKHNFTIVREENNAFFMQLKINYGI